MPRRRAHMNDHLYYIATPRNHYPDHLHYIATPRHYFMASPSSSEEEALTPKPLRIIKRRDTSSESQTASPSQVPSERAGSGTSELSTPTRPPTSFGYAGRNKSYENSPSPYSSSPMDTPDTLRVQKVRSRGSENSRQDSTGTSNFDTSTPSRLPRMVVKPELPFDNRPKNVVRLSRSQNFTNRSVSATAAIFEPQKATPPHALRVKRSVAQFNTTSGRYPSSTDSPSALGSPINKTRKLESSPLPIHQLSNPKQRGPVLYQKPSIGSMSSPLSSDEKVRTVHGSQLSDRKPSDASMSSPNSAHDQTATLQGDQKPRDTSTTSTDLSHENVRMLQGSQTLDEKPSDTSMSGLRSPNDHIGSFQGNLLSRREPGPDQKTTIASMSIPSSSDQHVHTLKETQLSVRRPSDVSMDNPTSSDDHVASLKEGQLSSYGHISTVQESQLPSYGYTGATKGIELSRSTSVHDPKPVDAIVTTADSSRHYVGTIQGGQLLQSVFTPGSSRHYVDTIQGGQLSQGKSVHDQKAFAESISNPYSPRNYTGTVQGSQLSQSRSTYDQKPLTKSISTPVSSRCRIHAMEGSQPSDVIHSTEGGSRKESKIGTTRSSLASNTSFSTVGQSYPKRNLSQEISPFDDIITAKDEVKTAPVDRKGYRDASSKHRMLNRLASGYSADNLDQPAQRSSSTTVRSALQDQKIASVLEKIRSPTPAGNKPLLKSFNESDGILAAFPRPPPAGIKPPLKSFDGINRILAAFPMPPGTLPNVQTSIPVSPQLETHTLYSRAGERLSMRGATIELISEKESVHASERQAATTFFVKVELKRAAIMTPSYGHFMENSDAVDVAFVIDNSFYTSAKTLMASFDIIKSLHSLLNRRRDRIAVFQTSSSPNELLRLSYIVPKQLKDLLDKIPRITTVPKPDYLALAVRQASQYLAQHVGCLTAGNQSPRVSSHVVVLTGYLDALPSFPIGHEQTSFHVISSGIIPWRREFAVAENVWHLHNFSESLNSPDPNVSAKRTVLQKNTEKFISNLHLSSKDSIISDLRVSLTACPPFSIESIMGPTRFAYLNYGETINMIVKMKMQPDESSLYNLQEFPQTFSPASTEFDLMSEINAILQDGAMQVLKAKLRYTHGGLPKGTRCEVTSVATMSKSSGLPPRSDQHSPKGSKAPSTLSEAKMHVQKCIFYHLATNANPREAMARLHEHWASDGGSAVFEPCLRAIIEELSFQKRAIERLEMEPSEREKADKARKERAKGNDKGSPRPQPAAPTTPTKLPDPARQLWRTMKVQSKGSLQGEMGSPQSPADQESVKKIQDRALRNKRSIGQETIRSMVQGSRGNENIAPWL